MVKLNLVCLILLSMMITSCATIFNRKTKKISVVTEVPTRLVINKDTIKRLSSEREIMVLRSRDPIKFTVFNDSISKTVEVNSNHSIAFWSNLAFCYGAGMLIDVFSPKRFTYPRIIYISSDTSDHSYLNYDPRNKRLNVVKVTPLKLVGILNPSVEFGYERKHQRGFSSEIVTSLLLPNSVLNPGIGSYRRIAGIAVSLEEKYYVEPWKPVRPYFAFEVNYLNKRYKDIWNFGVADIYDTTYQFTNYTDTFGIRKNTVSFNLKIGSQFQVFKEMTVEIYGGLGLKYRSVSHFDRINPDDEMEFPRHPSFVYASNRPGRYWTVSVPLNIRVGWSF